MATRRTFLKTSAALLAARNLCGQMVVARAAGLNMASAPADQFVDFISVQTHLNRRNTVWDQPTWRPLLGDLGIRYTRSALGGKLALEHVHALFADYGIRSSATFNAINDDGSFDLDKSNDVLAFLRDKVGAEKIYAIEGPNEYTHKYKTGDWAGRMKAYQEFLWTSVKSDSELKNIDVLAPTIWKRIIEDYEAISNMGAYADYGNLHLYNAGRKPSLFNRNGSETPVDLAIREAQIVIPGKPVCITETGFNVAEGAAPTKWTVPADVAAKYTLRNLVELFLRRDIVKRVNIYSLIDDEHKDDHFGLFDADLKPRPAYSALRRLIGLLKDPGPAFSAGPLTCQFNTNDPDARSLLLQKRDGRYFLLMWLDAWSYDRKTASATDIAPAPVSLEFGTTVKSVKIHAPTLSSDVQQELTNVSNMGLDVPDHVVVAEIVP
jgi:hypothetical protein